MYLLYKTPALILNYRDIGEADRFYFFFTEEYGLLKIAGRGIRNHYSKLRPNLELFSLANIGFVSKKDSWLLTQAEEISPFSGIKSESGKLSLVAGWSNFLLRFLQGQEKDGGLWDFTLKCFLFLNETNLNNAEMKNFDFYFKIIVLQKLGYIDKSDISAVMNLPLDSSAFRNLKPNLGEMSEILNKAVKESHL